ncbi:protein kinase [Pendulispora rubella]|uniref:Protein kinase n=1 Tax=Pendulispora rubella TaxID=2741070 RepID=A0ABZ2LHH9_9BACT
MQAEANLDQTVLDIVDARVGTVIRNKWHVDALLGTGGMAAVYAATHRNGNRVALKVLHLQLSVDQALSKRFKREGYAANAVQHPGVVRVLDDDVTEDGAAFLVMELLDGETAHHRAERLGGRLPMQDALTIVDGVLDILDTAHGGGIVHRDIKPENIFFTRDRAVKLFDFGIARLRNGGGPASHTAAAMGTPAFMPPEQALGHMDKVDALSDVWATGATMYTLLSGRLVHEYETANEVLIAAATRSALSLAEVAPDVAPEIVEVVDRALAYDKGRRWSSAKAMQHALRAAEESLSSSWGRISLVAAEASGSHPRISRVSVPEVAWRDTLSRVSRPLLGQIEAQLADTTGAELSVSVAKPGPKRRGWLVAATSGVLLALALVGTFVAMGRMRPPPQPNVAVESPSAPPPAPVIPSEPPVARATSVDLELVNPSPPATGKGAAKPRKPPPPREPPREKTWLDRRK